MLKSFLTQIFTIENLSNIFPLDLSKTLLCWNVYNYLKNIYIKTQVLSEILSLNIFQQGESCDSLAFLDLKSWDVYAENEKLSG